MEEKELSSDEGSGTEQTGDEATEGASGRFSRKAVAAMLGLGAVAGGTGSAAANHTGDTSSAKEWDVDRDANGNSLLNLDELWVDELHYDDLDVNRITDVDRAEIDEADLGHIYTSAREAKVVVWQDDSGSFHADGSEADGAEGTISSGDDFFAVVQAAVDSLTAGRTHKETVLVAASPSIPDDGSRQSIDLSSYTILDAPGRIDVGYSSGSNSGNVVVSATDASHVDIPRLNVTGGPKHAVRLESCSHVRLGNVSARFGSDADTGTAIRVGNEGSTRSSDVQIESAYVAGSGSHAVGLQGVDRGQVGRVLAKNQGGGGSQPHRRLRCDRRRSCRQQPRCRRQRAHVRSREWHD